MIVKVAVFCTVPSLAITDNVRVVVTGIVLTVKFASLVPMAMFTFGGTLATEPLTLSKIDTVAAALPVSRTSPVEGNPPFTLEGETLTESRIGARTPKLAPRDEPGTAACTNAVSGATTGTVEAEKTP